MKTHSVFVESSAIAGQKAISGFTLIEVLVAIAITSIALLAGLQAAMALTNNSLRQSDMLLAHLCAENELAKARLSGAMPAVGSTTLECEQAGRNFTLLVSVLPTANASFRRIDVQVSREGAPVAGLWTLVGRD